MKIPRPQKQETSAKFLESDEYYRKSIPWCAELMAPLTYLTEKQSPNVVNSTSEL